MAGSISVGGLATGLDTKSIVTQLMALERRPETLLKNEKSTLQSQVNIFNQLNAAFSSLQGVMAGMNTATTFAAYTAAVSDTSVLTAQTTGAAMPGSHTVVVNSLATNQRQISHLGSASASDTNLFKTGTITISDGVPGHDPVSVVIGAGENSLSGIASAINASEANLTASIINDGSGAPYRLMITGTDTGNYTIDTSQITLDSSQMFDSGDPTYVAGANASLTVDGLAVTSSSNTVTGVLPGVTLSLLKGGGADGSFTIASDNTAVTAKINNFISSYNNAIGIIRQQSAYNSTTKTAGVLSGDSTIRALQANLQNIVSGPVEGVSGGPYNLLSQIGISTARDGTLSLDTTKLSTALSADFDGVADLFTHNSGTSGLAASQYGIAEQFNQVLEQITNSYVGPGASSNGIISTRINSLQGRMTGIDKQVARMELLMAKKEESLNRQFTAMEMLVSSLQSQGNQMIAALNATLNQSK